MTRRVGVAAAAAFALALLPAGSARAQFYPGGYGGWGWGGWGGGETVQGSVARGLGVFAAGAGMYNQQTAVANSINADTVMRWNQYMYDSQRTANRAERERLARRQFGTIQAQDKLLTRLRDNPEQRDIYQGSALNVALEEINNPRVYAKALKEANVKVGGDLIKNIPFQYAAAAITTSISQITREHAPEALRDPRFKAEADTLKEFGGQIRAQLDKGEPPDPALIDKALNAVHALEARVDETLKRNTPDRVACDRFLKSVHGLLAMMKTPALDVLLAGVENRPEATLGELLQFMNSFNLRFGVAQTAQQRQAYEQLWPKLDALRDKVAVALADTGNAPSKGTAAGEFFSGMAYEDLQKRAPAPPKPKAPNNP